MTERNMVEAINSALTEEMQRDERVMLLGLDVGKLGGVFRTTTGLVDKFGAERVVDTPLAEASIIGASLGWRWRAWCRWRRFSSSVSPRRPFTRSDRSSANTASARAAATTARSPSARR